MMRTLISATGLVLLLALGGGPAAAQDRSPSIVGVWKLTSFTRNEVATGKSVQPFGAQPTGFRIHTPGGHASYMFFATDRKAPAGAVTDEDRIELYKTMTAASGTYKVDGNKVAFQADVSSNQSIGSKLTYEFRITGSTLTMTTDPVKTAAGEVVFVTSYERVE